VGGCGALCGLRWLYGHLVIDPFSDGVGSTGGKVFLIEKGLGEDRRGGQNEPPRAWKTAHKLQKRLGNLKVGVFLFGCNKYVDQWGVSFLPLVGMKS